MVQLVNLCLNGIFYPNKKMKYKTTTCNDMGKSQNPSVSQRSKGRVHCMILFVFLQKQNLKTESKSVVGVLRWCQQGLITFGG